MSALVEVKTAELEGRALDWAVADAIGLERPNSCDSDGVWRRWHQPVLSDGEPWGDEEPFSPSTDWAHVGPLAEKHRVRVDWNTSNDEDPGYDPEPWICVCGGGPFAYGATALVGICRAIVAAKLGDTVSVPAELVGGGV